MTTNLKAHIWRVLSLLSVVLLFGISANARIFVVTDTNDTVGINSLRGAIIAASGIRGNNTIVLGQPGRQQQIYLLTQSGNLVIAHGNLTIVGASPEVTIDATVLGDRVFQVASGATLTLRNLTVTGGLTYSGWVGGAIFNAGTLTIDHCSIVGNSSGPGDALEGIDASGGGIFNQGTLLVENSVIAGNVAGTDGHGGGIFNSGRALVDHCIINSNSSGSDGNSVDSGFSVGNGGGICNAGTMTVRDCIVSANQGGHGGAGYLGAEDILIGTPADGGPGGSGAGIFNSGNLTLLFSTVSGNTCGPGGDGGSGDYGGNPGGGGNGGGIANIGILEANTCTISGNLSGNGGNGGNGGEGGGGGSGGQGGGIYNGGIANLTSCTITLNQTGAGGNGGSSGGSFTTSGGPGGSGGGIFNDTVATNSIRNTLTALNLANVGGLGGTNQGAALVGNNGADGAGFDVAGDFTSQGFNLIGIADGSTGFANNISTLYTDQVGSNTNPIDPLLGPLQMNGGFTPTQALFQGSPAIDNGKCFGTHTDQRGHRRPQVNPTLPGVPGGDHSDIGAFELDVR